MPTSTEAGPTRVSAGEFDWVGTDDPTAWLAVPAAIRTMAELVPGGWPEIMRVNRETALLGRRIVGDALGVEDACPADMVGSLAALPIADGPAHRSSPMDVDPLGEWLLRVHRIEVPIASWPAPPRRVLRLSAQLYNERADYESLARALRERPV